MKTFLSTAAAIVLMACFAAQSQAGLIVTGNEVGPSSTPGLFDYTLTFSHSGAADPILDPPGAFGVTFNIAAPLVPSIFTPSGSLTDGTHTLTPGLSSWGGVFGDQFDPNGITSGSTLTFSATTSLAATGDDFSTVNIGWNFGADVPLTGIIQQATTPPVVPEPSALAVFLVGMLGAVGARRRRDS